MQLETIAAPAPSANQENALASLAVLIPAYEPGPALVQLAKSLRAHSWKTIVVVDDGSGPEYAAIFREIGSLPDVHVVAHAVNLGKGAALKMGINFILCAYPDIAAVVTVDADGQHDPEDVRACAARISDVPGSLILGVRSFTGKVPLRSRFGNAMTRGVLRVVLGYNLEDTQTGLRVIPAAMLPHLLRVASSGYEFELDMLIAAKHFGISVVQQPIRTIYEPGNPTSHFHPLRDSMRIYFVLFRFASISLMTAALDNVVFALLFRMTGTIFASQCGARVAAVIFNYTFVRNAVFLSGERHKRLLPRYLLLVALHTLVSYACIRLLMGSSRVPVYSAKILVETGLFVVNFVIQRDYVFRKRGQSPSLTDQPGCAGSSLESVSSPTAGK